MKPRDWHYAVSLLLVAALIPVLRSQHLPVKFDWMTLGVAYWLVLAPQAIFVAVLLCLIGFPRNLWGPFFARYRANPLRIVIAVVFLAVLAWSTTWLKALVLTCDTIAILELRDRQKMHGLRRSAASVLMPAAYFFFGFLLVLAYNSAIVSARFNFATDPAFAAADRWLLHGHAVWELSHWAVRTFPISFFHFLEFIYFGMFPQIGATIILLTLSGDRKRGLQFVGAVLMSYYIALLVFYLWPAQGPYYLCPAHFTRFPRSLQSYRIQSTLIAHALALFQHQPIARISTDYFIAFPCMHIVQPLIMLWFLRGWRRIVMVMAIYDVVLIVAIVLLEMHYVVDIVAGVLVAAVAIAITEGFSFPGRTRPGPQAEASVTG